MIANNCSIKWLVIISNSLKGLHLDKNCNNPYSETNSFGVDHVKSIQIKCKENIKVLNCRFQNADMRERYNICFI